MMNENRATAIGSGAVHTVNPRGNCTPFSMTPDSMLESVNFLRHSAQKSNSSCPSSCFCSSLSRYLDWVISNFPPPCNVTRHTRKLVPPDEFDGLHDLLQDIKNAYLGRRQDMPLSLDLKANRIHTLGS